MAPNPGHQADGCAPLMPYSLGAQKPSQSEVIDGHMRDDFSIAVKEALAGRVGLRCSNPDCRQLTSGPKIDPAGVINVGVAAHITAAASGGPRYEPSLAPVARRAADNGIWLCQKCAKLIDSDPSRYTAQLLQGWKRVAEQTALAELESRPGLNTALNDPRFTKAERLVPKLLAEMRQDVARNPLSREFVLLKRNWSYWSKGHELVYYYDDHPGLDNQMRVLQNLGLIEEITYNNVDRFVMCEELADYLSTPNTWLAAGA